MYNVFIINFTPEIQYDWRTGWAIIRPTGPLKAEIFPKRLKGLHTKPTNSSLAVRVERTTVADLDWSIPLVRGAAL